MDELIRQGANPLEPLETFDTSENFDIPKDASEVDAWLEASVDNKEIKQAIDVKLTELTQFGKAEAKTMLKNNPDTFLLLKAYTGDEDLGVLELQALEKSLGNMLENHAKQALKEELDGLISDFENWPTNSEPDFNFDPDIIPGGSNQVSTAPENIEDLTTQILDDAERNRTKPS